MGLYSGLDLHSRSEYIRLSADYHGISRFEDVEKLLSPLDFAPPAPALNLSSFSPAERLAFMEAPAGWHGKQHPAPQRQFFFFYLLYLKLPRVKVKPGVLNQEVFC